MTDVLLLIPVVFAAGGLLLLEYRCTGTAALVQPIVLCVLAGMVVDMPWLGIWIGTVLQTASVGQHHYCNWVLAAAVACAAILAAPALHVELVPGNPETLVVLISAVLWGILSHLIEHQAASFQGVPLASHPLWNEPNALDSLSRRIRREIFGAWMRHGLFLVSGYLVTTTMMWAVSDHAVVSADVQNAVALATVGFGAAVTLSVLSKKRYLPGALLGAGLVWVWGLL